MADDQWMRDHMVKQAEHTATILNELKTGANRMTGMEQTLAEVVECTREFPALKISVTELEAAEEKREKDKIAALTLKLANKEQEEKEKKAIWSGRLWEVGLKLATPVLIAAYVIYSLVKEQL